MMLIKFLNADGYIEAVSADCLESIVFPLETPTNQHTFGPPPANQPFRMGLWCTIHSSWSCPASAVKSDGSVEQQKFGWMVLKSGRRVGFGKEGEAERVRVENELFFLDKQSR